MPNKEGEHDFWKHLEDFMSLKTVKDYSGFIIGGLLILLIKHLMGDNANHAIAFLGLTHLAGIFVLDFIHKKTIRKVHVTVTLFWIFYILADYGLITLSITSPSDGKIYIPNIILSLIIASYLSGIASSLRDFHKKRDPKEDE